MVTGRRYYYLASKAKKGLVRGYEVEPCKRIRCSPAGGRMEGLRESPSKAMEMGRGVRKVRVEVRVDRSVRK